MTAPPEPHGVYISARQMWDKLREQLAARDQKIEGLLEQRVADQVEIARLRVKVVNLGGDP